MLNLAVKIKNYKCFKDETGFDTIRRVNLIIGRNNVGKSSLLDIIEIVTSGNYVFDSPSWRENQRPQIYFQSQIPENITTRTFPDNIGGGVINGNHGVYGRQYIGRNIKWAKTGSASNINSELIECDDTGISPPLKNCGDYLKRLPNNMPVPLEGKTFRRLLAERDILPEVAVSSSITIENNGNGLTNVIQSFINHSNLPSALVEEGILDALNGTLTTVVEQTLSLVTLTSHY